MPFASERVMGTSGACRSRAQGSGRHGFVPWRRLRYKARAAIVVTGWRVEFVLKENTPFERRWCSCTGNICLCSSFFVLVSSLVCARAEWQRERGLLREGRRGSGNNRFDFHLISCNGKAPDGAMASQAARVRRLFAAAGGCLMLRHERVPLRPSSLSLGCRSGPAGETITGVLIPYSQAKSLLSRRCAVPEASDRDLPEEQK